MRSYYHRRKNYYRPRFGKSTFSASQIIGGAVLLILFTGILAITGTSIRNAIISLIVFLIMVLSTLVGIIVFILRRKHNQTKKHLKALSISNVDKMSGIQFEKYLKYIFEDQGFSDVEVTQAEGDFGADLLATKNGKRYAIQAKQYAANPPFYPFPKPVGVEAIYQVLGGKQYYHTDETMVITTSRFTIPAHELVKKSGTILIDRTTLPEWIAHFTKV